MTMNKKCCQNCEAKKLWLEEHPYYEASFCKKGISSSKTEIGEWYWFPKLKQWAMRDEGFDDRNPIPLFFGPNGFAKRVFPACTVHKIKSK